jgi:hypothetical protein
MRLVLLLPLLAAVLPAQSTGSYFPLDVGDRWVYREDDRIATAQYQTWRVDRTAAWNGTAYSVMAIEGPGTLYAEYWFRADSSGRVYILTGNGDQLFLDPNILAPNSGEVQLTGQGGAVTTPLGTFPDTVNYVNPMGLDYETGTLARGVGLLSSLTDLETGSSGGPTLIRTLVEAALAGSNRYPAQTSSIGLGMESLDLNVSGKQVTNCAVPCYFVACYLAPGADPPGTYKPCAQARVALRNWPAGLSRTVRLELLAADGSAAFDQTLAMDAAPVESVIFIQVPLYSAPNQPLPAGAYQLSAKTADGAAQSAVTVAIR